MILLKNRQESTNDQMPVAFYHFCENGIQVDKPETEQKEDYHISIPRSKQCWIRSELP